MYDVPLRREATARHPQANFPVRYSAVALISCNRDSRSGLPEFSLIDIMRIGNA
jgi:hypothetical protein